MTKQEILEEFEFLGVEESSRKPRKGGNGAVTIINAEKKNCGSRLLISKQVERDLELKDSLQIAVSRDGDYLLVGKSIDESQPVYSLRRLKKDNSDSKLVLYCKGVIERITEKMNLDFTENVSVTFYGVEYIDVDGKCIAKISKEVL